MRVGILMCGESGRPWFFTSKVKAEDLVKKGTHKKLSKKVYQEVIPNTTYCSTPERRYTSSLTITVTEVPFLNPPAIASNLVLYYPVRDMSSIGPRNFRELWGGEISIPSFPRLKEVYGPLGYATE